MPVRGMRGATTATANTKEAILEATQEMLELLIEANNVDRDEVASAYFTTTPDLNAEFPAVAARKLGWTSVPLMCGHEMSVPGSLPMCVRVMLHVNTEVGPHDITHVYVRGARALRPDLSTSEHSTAR
jgi:chorismate mutase